jgi:hypothetical protein
MSTLFPYLGCSVTEDLINEGDGDLRVVVLTVVEPIRAHVEDAGVAARCVAG